MLAQPMSSPMMNTMFGRCCWAVAGPQQKADAKAEMNNRIANLKLGLIITSG
jgi:hypothetical protein